MDQYKTILIKYLPDNSLDPILEWLKVYQIHLHISKSRVTKLGDFRPSPDCRVQKITVNHNLNPYAFLITLIHEISHVIVWRNCGNRVRPHGKEWKNTFRQLILSMVERKVFPPSLEQAIIVHVRNPKASSSSDLQLSLMLKEFDDQPGTILEELPLHSAFTIHNGKRFKKMEKQKKRYRCICLDNDKVYLISPLMSVNPALEK